MRLLFVFSRYPAETFAIVEVEALRNQGIDVVPLTLRGGRRWLRRNHPNRDRQHERVTAVPLTSAATWAAFGRFFLRYPLTMAHEIGSAIRENILHPAHLVRSLYVCLKAPAVAELMRRQAIDGVHVFWGHYPALIIPFIKREMPDLPVTAFLGAYSVVKRIPSGPRALADADVITTHFEGHVEELRSGWLKRPLPIALIYRGVELQQPPPERIATCERPRLVIVSRMEVNKNVEDGLRAFALVQRQHPNLLLDVIGSGPCEASLRRLVRQLKLESAITFHGLLPHAKALSLIAGAQALVLPSLSPYDAYPNAVKEAMALRIPCAAYAIPGVAQYDLSGKAIRLARPGRVEELAQAIAELIEDRELARRMIEAALLRVRDFDIRITSARQAELYRALVARTALPEWVLQSPPVRSSVKEELRAAYGRT